MSDWKWAFKTKTGEIITIHTKDSYPPSKTKAIAELARAHAGGGGRSEETLKKIGYALQPELLELVQIFPELNPPLPVFTPVSLH